jgi:VanZ family protein
LFARFRTTEPDPPSDSRTTAPRKAASRKAATRKRASGKPASGRSASRTSASGKAGSVRATWRASASASGKAGSGKTKARTAAPAPGRRRPWPLSGSRDATAGRRKDSGGGRSEAPPDTPLLQRRSATALAARWLVLAALLVGMVGFAVALARVTLVPSPSSDALVHTNLRPGASIRAYLDQPETRDTVKQIGGNVLLGLPFGILLPTLFPSFRGLVRVALLTALVMVIVEAAQGTIVEGRAFDIDDVILNTAGALIGYLLLGRRLGRALHPRRVHWWHRLGYGTAPRPPER